MENVLTYINDKNFIIKEMKVLWITNILFPQVFEKLQNGKKSNMSGGWMIGAADALIQLYDVKLYVATVSRLVKQLTRLEVANVIYYIIPAGKGNCTENKEYIPFWKTIQNEINPDIVHIHGTEYSHGYSYIKACGKNNVIISIQGLISICSRFYLGNLSLYDIYSNITLRDIFKGTIISEQKRFRKRGDYEKDMIRSVDYIIGRTSWDKSHVLSLNPNVLYYYCNETLRSEFYNAEVWNYSSCKKHSIFLTQAGYPLKGFHQVLKAMPFILQKYPDTTIRVAGENIIRNNSISDIMHYTGYGKYVKKLIKKLGLENKITFVGKLNAEQMKNEYLNSNVFICPSSIENSSNSLGEAQLLGVPCIASYVGGNMDMMKSNEDNLYRFEEVEMLANKICSIFESEETQIDMTSIAYARHNKKENANQLYNIYIDILKRNK